VNLRYYPRGRFFWDERAGTLEQQVLMPIQSKTEMGTELPKLMGLLAKDDHYPRLFRQAFGEGDITPERTARALAQFLRSMVSYRQKYEGGMAQVLTVRADSPNFPAEENRGKRTFLANCATCHLPQNQQAHFIMNRPLNNGLDADVKKSDGG